MEKERIVRKDGIEYYRKKRNQGFDCRLNVKYYRDKIERLKKIAEKQGKKYQPLVREILENYIKKMEN